MKFASMKADGLHHLNLNAMLVLEVLDLLQSIDQLP